MSPLFDYQCQHCGHTFEVQMPVSRLEDIPHCPKCGSYLAVRLPAAPTFTIKGYNAANGYTKKE